MLVSLELISASKAEGLSLQHPDLKDVIREPGFPAEDPSKTDVADSDVILEIIFKIP
jgi:hypothetical protein